MRQIRILLTALCLMLCLLASAAADAPVYLSPPPADWAGRTDLLTVRMLNLGPCDALLLECGGTKLLIDGGTDAYRDGMRRGLEAYGFTDVQYLLNTHPHSDHIDATAWLLSRGLIHTNYFLTPWPETSADRHHRKMVSAVHKQGVKYHQLRHGDKLALGNAVLSFSRWDEGQTGNQQSLITRVTFGDAVLLLPSDASGLAEKWWLSVTPEEEQRADILKMPHHGVDRTVAGYLEAISPQMVIFAKRASNSGDVLQQIERAELPHLHTGSGTVTLVTDGHAWYVTQLHREI